jgi:hypothetical protein
MKKRSILSLIGFIFLLLAGISPFFIVTFNLIVSQKLERARTPISFLLVQPTALVYSSDYFFNYVKIKITDTNVERILPWDDLVALEMKKSYVYHIYLRHLFNGSGDLSSKSDSIKNSLKYFICQNQSKLEILKNIKPIKVTLTLSAPFRADLIDHTIEVHCEQ